MELSKHYLVGLKACFMREKLSPTLLRWSTEIRQARNLGKTEYYCSPKNSIEIKVSASCSDIIREAASCSRWEQIQRATIGQCAENE